MLLDGTAVHAHHRMHRRASRVRVSAMIAELSPLPMRISLFNSFPTGFAQTLPRVLTGLAVIGAIACHTGANRGEYRSGDITVADVFLVAPIANAPAAMYFTVRNDGTAADTLVSVHVDGVQQADLHQEVRSAMPPGMAHDMSHDMSVMTMTPTPAVPVAAGTTLRLHPGDRHVMLTGMQRTFARGDSVAATVTFARRGAIPVHAHVIDYTQIDTLRAQP